MIVDSKETSYFVPKVRYAFLLLIPITHTRKGTLYSNFVFHNGNVPIISIYDSQFLCLCLDIFKRVFVTAQC